MTDLDRLDALAGRNEIAARVRNAKTPGEIGDIFSEVISERDAAVRERDELRDLLLVMAHDMHDYAIVAQEDPLHPGVTWNVCTDDRCASARAALHREAGT